MVLKPNAGRALSALGAVVVVLALFLTWYHIDRATNTTTTGWQTFTRLRVLIVVAALLTLATALVAQVRLVLIGRTVLGLVVALLILRRIVFPPEASGTVTAQIGVYVGLAAALLVAAGGLVDSGRRVVEAYPTLRRQPVAELGRGSRALDRGDDGR